MTKPKETIDLIFEYGKLSGRIDRVTRTIEILEDELAKHKKDLNELTKDKGDDVNE